MRLAAHQLFEEKGLQKTSVREIAKSAGYTTGAVYFHYDSKEAIYSEILLLSLKSLTKQIIQASEEKREPFSALIAAYLAFYRFYSEASQKLNFDVFFAGSDINSAYLPEFAAEFEKINRCFEKNMSALGIDPTRTKEEATLILGDLIGLVLTLKNPYLTQGAVIADALVASHLKRLSARLLEQAKSGNSDEYDP